MNKTLRGCFLALAGGICWGISGSVGQYLFTVQRMDSRWLVPIRLGLAGILLFAYCLARHREPLFHVWRDKVCRRELVVYGLFGVASSQFFYFLTIQLAGAAMGTILQDLGPAFILIAVCVSQHRAPKLREIISLLLALAGVLLLASHGSPSALSASAAALLTGVISGICVAVYNLAPAHVAKLYPMPVMLSWAFLMGGAFFALFFRSWTISYVPNAAGLAGIACVVIVGNIMAFSLYTAGVNAAGPVKAVLFGFSEPVTAAVLTVAVFHGSFNLFDLTGFICIFIMLVLTAKK
jgi:drug/metabolite transporter (DMT)-like permease